MKLSKGFLP